MKKVQLFLAVISYLFLGAISFAGDLPDPKLTPGATNPEVTQDNIQSTICVKGYTKTIRPPANYTNKLKKQQLREYALSDTNPKHYEEDHLISLEIGGDPRDPRNLWPEPYLSEWNAHRKDELENALHRMVCKGQIRLAEAQAAISGDWIAAYRRYVQ